MFPIEEILDKLKSQDRGAQKTLYTYLAPIMMATSIRYVKSRYEAEDFVQEAFIKVFTKISEFRNDCPIEFWAKRILINGILQEFRKNKKQMLDVEEHSEQIDANIDASQNLLHQDLLKMVNMLPEGKRVVFNLYAIEGFSHKEIAEQLEISESTSKSQLLRAKEILVELHKKYNQNHARTVS